MDKLTFFIDNPNKKLYCPICKSIYTEPVLTECGHTFCKLCITRQLDKCPLDGIICKLKLVNGIISEQIDDLLIRCTYGVRVIDENLNDRSCTNLTIDENGCTENICYGKRNEHESQCPHRVLNCPNSTACPLIKFRDLQEHLSQCKNLKCPFSTYHCSFIGLKDEIAEHVKTCRYQDFKDVVTFYDEKLSSYEDTINKQFKIILKKDEQLESLTQTIGAFSTKLDCFEKKIEQKLSLLEENQQSIIDEMNKEYKRLNDDMSYLKLKLNETKTKNLELIADKEAQTTVKCLGTFVGHTNVVKCLLCYNDNLISGSLDDYIKIWDITSKYSCIKTLESNTGGVCTMAIKDTFLYSVGYRIIKAIIWNLDTYQKIYEFICNDNLVYSILAIESKIIIGSTEVIKVYGEPRFQLLKELKEDEDTLVCTLKVFNKYLYTGSLKAFKIWDLASLILLQKVALPGRVITSIVMYSRYVIVANDNSIYVLDSKTYQILSTLNGHRAQIIDLVVAQSNLGDKLFSASRDQTLRVWSLENLICTEILHRHEGNVTALAVMQNRVFSGSMDTQIKVWQINAFGMMKP